MRFERKRNHVLGLLLLGTVVAGCNPAIHLSTETAVHPSLRDWSVPELTRLFNRQVQAAEDIEVSATLWDMAFIVAFQEARTTRKEQTAEVAKQNIELWRQRFLVGQTAFRVRVELLNRGEVLSGKDRILLLKQWSWRMKLSDGAVVPYKKIHLELAKRYKAEGGLYHHRLDGVVHFDKRVDASKHRFVELWAYPPGDRPVAKLRWNLKQP